MLSTTNTPGTLIRNASRRDALTGVVDDYLIRYTLGTLKTNKRPQAPTVANEERRKSGIRYGTYWDKKTDALESDGVAKTDPIKRGTHYNRFSA